MRKALIGMILAATAVTPVAAWAQDEDNARVERVRQRMEQRQEARTERREQRQEVRTEQPPEARVERREERVERRQERVERRQARQEPTVQVQQQTQPGIRAFNRRGERNLARSSDGGLSADPALTARQDRDGDRRDWRRDRDGDRRDWRQDRRADRRDWRRDWNRTSWRNDNRYDWQSWRYRNRSLFRLSPYYSPFRNHRYSRFSIGLFLQPSFYSQRYWLSDPFQYRLPYAPPGTQWVRYYNDVLLVDTWSGEVVDVIYDFFW
jgi:hypothetical protein